MHKCYNTSLHYKTKTLTSNVMTPLQTWSHFTNHGMCIKLDDVTIVKQFIWLFVYEDDVQFSTWIYLMHHITSDNSLSNQERFSERILWLSLGNVHIISNKNLIYSQCLETHKNYQSNYCHWLTYIIIFLWLQEEERCRGKENRSGSISYSFNIMTHVPY